MQAVVRLVSDEELSGFCTPQANGFKFRVNVPRMPLFGKKAASVSST